MDPLAALRGGTSGLARVARSALAGLAASLRHALREADADDPLRPAVLAALAALEDETPAAPVAAVPVVAERPALLASWQMRPEGKGLAKLNPDAPDVARRLWLYTCRLAPATAAAWRAEWSGDAPTPGEPPSARAVPTPTTPIARRLAAVVNRLLWFIEHDPDLWHMLRAVYRFGLIELSPKQRDRYVVALLARYEALRQAEEAGDARAQLAAWVDLDEAAHALVHRPVAAATSDFGRVSAASREAAGEVRDLAARAGLSFHFQVLTGAYADLRGLSDPDGDVATDLEGAPGDVVHCARMYLKLDDVRHPGRVLYRTR